MASKKKDIITEYLEQSSWKGAENASSTYSLQGLNQYITTAKVTKYWLKHIYSPEIRRMYEENRFHIHDLGFLSSYCSGWSVEDLLLRGFGGVENKVHSRPAKYLNTALNQVVNFLFTLQGELAGAQAISNLDTYMAPFIRKDHMSYHDVFKAVQSFVYLLNTPTRVGFQAPFTNISFDITCPKNLKDKSVIIGGQLHDTWVYGDFQQEMDTFNRAFCDAMSQGDGNGSIFTFPIPTYNLYKGFDWTDERYKPIWEMTAKYGAPYFANFVNSDLNPDDFRSMCCRLRLDVSKLQVRNGGMFGSTPLTGSIGVVTLNMPNLAIRTLRSTNSCGSSEIDDTRVFEAFKAIIKETVDVASQSLEKKREVIEKEWKLYPYAAAYLSSIRERTGKLWANHFSTIGINGMNEACQILYGKSIADPGCKEISLRILEYIKGLLVYYQAHTQNLYNLEATPAESTSYKFALKDRELFPEWAKCLPEYYTNSTMLPVSETDDIFAALDNQEALQRSYTGGTVFHAFLGEKLDSWEQARDLVKMMTTKYKVPYVSLTPTFSVCKTHKYISGEHSTCPTCGKPCLVYSRIVGYYRPVQDWNKGKKAEFIDRKYYTRVGQTRISDISVAPAAKKMRTDEVMPGEEEEEEGSGTAMQVVPPPPPSPALHQEKYMDIKVGGFMPFSSINWPGCPAHSVLFLSGCNLACPWCHNGTIARGGVIGERIKIEDVIQQVVNSSGKALVISGGEPTVQMDALVSLMQVLKGYGIKLKLDTNGVRTKDIKEIIDKHLVDFIAMDVKGKPENYEKIAGVRVGYDDPITASIDLIKKSGVPHQFRTTVVPDLVDIEDVKWAKQAIGPDDKLMLHKFASCPMGRHYSDAFSGWRVHTDSEFAEYEKVVAATATATATAN